MSIRKRILVADDEPVIRDIVRECLHVEHDVTLADGVESALQALADEPHDVLLADVRMPGGGGIELAQRALEAAPDLAVIVMTGRGNLEEFVSLLRMGITDYLLKPFTPAEIRRAVSRAVEIQRLRTENERLRRETAASTRIDTLVGESQAMRDLGQRIALVAPTDATVLITGHCGTGKELAARAIHQLSSRAAGPFLAVHCGALPEQLLESELFGHAKGAFTGAIRARAGRFDEAMGGTLFLDEVGTMSSALQVRLLRILGSHEYTRVGDDRVRQANVRIVAATNVDLAAMVAEGRFRDDLYYRLNVVPVRMPALSERMGDINLLADHLLRVICERLGRQPKTLEPAALERLHRHSWPGNVRELENALERAVILAGDAPTLAAEDILVGSSMTRRSGRLELPADGLDLPGVLERIERRMIEQALSRTDNNRQQAANLLGLQRTTLVQKLRRSDDASPDS